MSEVLLVYGVNDEYAPAAAASLRSVIACADPARRYRVCILHMGLESRHQERLRAMGTENVSVEIIDVSCLARRESWPSNSRFGPEIYLRLYAPAVCGSSSKLLYLDADTILLRDAAELYDLPLNGAALGACWSFATPFMDGYVRRTVGLEPEDYFNSGVLLIDAKIFERQDIRTRCLQILRVRPRLICFDQDALNLALGGRFCRLPDRWNVQWTGHLHPRRDLSERPENAQRRRIGRAEAEAALLHYASDFKPWAFPCAWGAGPFWSAAFETPYREEFMELYTFRRENPKAFAPIIPPWRGFRRSAALAGYSYAARELISNVLRLDGGLPC